VTRRLVGWALVCAVLFGAVLTVVVLEKGQLARADLALLERTVDGARSFGWLRRIAEVATWLGSEWFLLSVCAVCAGLLLLRGHWVPAVWLTATAWGSVLLNTVVKAAVRRERPVDLDAALDPTGWSFPSGHSQGTVVCWVALILVLGGGVLDRVRARHAAVVVVVAAAAVVGWSRVALGVHWPSDVLGGWLLGTAWVLASVAVLDRGRRHQPAEPASRA